MEKLARYKPGDNITGVPLAEDIVAGTFVMVVEGAGTGGLSPQGDYVIKPASANLERPFGVAERSVDVSELADTDVDKRTNIVRRGAVARVLCEGAIKAGEEVYIAGAGKVKKFAAEKLAVGRCVRGGTDTYIEVDVY